MSFQRHLDILSVNTIPINQDFIVTLTKGSKEYIDKERRNTCKVLKFTSTWIADEVMTKIYRLIPKSLPNLLIFIIEVKSFKNFHVAKITEKLAMFGKHRHIILQINSDDTVPVDERKTKILFKQENSEDFLDTKGQRVNTTKNFYNFSTFLWLCMNETTENLCKKVLKKLQNAHNSSIILKFLRVLKLPEQFFNELVLKYAAHGTKSDFMMTVDGFINERGKLNFLHPKFITNTLIDYKSALYVAIQHSNKEVIEFLIKKCTHLIQQLPFRHQIDTSAIALTTIQISVLYDLLNVADFPFPDDMRGLRATTDKKLKNLIMARIKFHKDVQAADVNEIKKFIAENPNLKFGYNHKNKSALSQALSWSKYESFFLLKANRYRDNEIENYDDHFDDDEDKSTAGNLASVQRRENVDSSTPDKDRSVLLLATRSFIYNRTNENKFEEEQREKIRKWYKDIEKTKLGTKLIDVASQCNDLKIIYDFECDSVENVDVSKSRNAQGTTYPKSKWIFIGAKLSEYNSRDQEIKGVIAHEICHFVMRMVYKNDEKPYYKDNVNAAKEFDVIVTEIKAMLFPKKEEKDTTDAENLEIDDDEEFLKTFNEETERESRDCLTEKDECDGIISSVYECYQKDELHIELIVRPVQIQTQFDDEPEKVAELEEKYKKLFEFCEKSIIPELIKFNLKQRGTVENFNNFVGFLEEIQNLNIELSTVKDMAEIFEKNLVILTSNVPKLLKFNIYKFLSEKYGELLETQNIFVDPKRLQNFFVMKNFKGILQDQKNLNIFVDCSRGFIMNIDFISPSDELKFIFIVANNNDCLVLTKKIEEKSLTSASVDLQYTWSDLTPTCQENLLNTKVNFQNDSSSSLFKLISKVQEEESALTGHSTDIIDDQLFNLLLEKSKIIINSQSKEEINELKFKILFQSRKFVVNFKIGNILMPNDIAEVVIEKHDGSLTRKKLRSLINRKSSVDSSASLPDQKNSKSTKLKVEFVNVSKKLTLNQVLDDVKDMKYVLISDKAGSGKSWVFKNLAIKLQDIYPLNWITYVDLKQFIPVLRSNQPVDFEEFMIDKIIKPKNKYEAGIFKKLFKDGKVCILFDGFDEIAPDYAEFVTKLFLSFQQNDGNQLWIATRDSFEKDLKENLGLDRVYKLDEFTEKHGVELIVFTWILSEIGSDLDYQSETDIHEIILAHPNFQKYKEIATKLSEKVPKSQTTSIGLPQFYKIIADVSIDNKNAVINYTAFKLFEECVNIQYERWSNRKGQLIRQESILSQHKGLNFHKLHQLIAMESLFPEDSKFCDLDIEDLKDWTEQQIIACGFLHKIMEKIFFLQQTFREYYAADFVRAVLTKQGSKLDESFCKYLIQFLTVQKFMIIRMFLNEVLGEKAILDKVEPKTQKIAANFCKNFEKLENLSNIFEENLGNLVKFLFEVFNRGNNKQIIKILNKNSNIVLASAKHEELFTKVTNFIVKYCKSSDLRKFIIESQILITIFASPLNVKVIGDFIAKIEDKTDPKFVCESLQARNSNGENLLFNLIKSEHLNAQKLKETLSLLQNHLKDPKSINKVIIECNNDNWNVLHVTLDLKDIKKLEIIWPEMKNWISKNQLKDSYLINQKTMKNGHNPLHLAALCQEFKFHEALWKNSLNSFKKQDLKDLIFQTDKSNNNFICALIANNKADVIEFTFQQIDRIFLEPECKRIFTSRGNLNRNLLQIAARSSTEIKTHQILWKFQKDSCKTGDKFSDVLKSVDIRGNNVFQIAAKSTTSEIFEFMIFELEKVAKKEEIVLILNKIVHWKKNLLQIAAKHNKSLEFHKSLWIIIQKYFNASEIVSMIQHTDLIGDNFFYYAVKFNAKEVVEFSWNQMMNSMDKTRMNYSNTKLRKYSQMNKLNTEVEKWCDALLAEYNFTSNLCHLM